MRVFVAGGTGVVGRRVVPLLLSQGHEVTVLVRSPEKAEAVRRAGARAAEVSLFDPAGLARSVRGHEAVVNLATSIPPFSRAALSRAWKLNDRIRAEGSRNLADAAAAAGVERFVQESVAYLYADAGSEWIFEDHLVRPSVITASAGEAENQARRLVEYGCATVVLRFGAFYGPDSSHTITALRMARLGAGTTPGNRDAYLSSVSTDDAAAAVMSALEAPSGIYNVVDDEPVTRAVFDLTLARAMGRERLRPMPGPIVRMLGDKLDHVKRSQRVSNRSLREKTAWVPRYRSVREGLPAVAAALGHQAVPASRVGQDRNVTGADAGLAKPEDRE